MLIGVTGNIGSGKTKVAEKLGELIGAEVLDADSLCRKLMEPGEEGFLAFIPKGGERFLTTSGEIDRAALRKALFREPDLRKTLESILHPLVRKEVVRMGLGCEDSSSVVAEIPLLFESGWENDFDTVVTVTADEKIMVERVVSRDGGEPRNVRDILDVQMSQGEKSKKADYVIDNSGEWAFTEKQIIELAVKLKRKNKEVDNGN